MAATAGRVTWDIVGERFWETGVSQGMLYPTIDTAHDGGFTDGVSWSGLTSVSESPSGADANEQYADNIKYLNLRSAEDFGFTIEAFYYPEEFGECDGTKALANGGIVMRQQTRKTFGFSFVSKIGNDTVGDDYGEKLHLYYNATVNPSESQYQTVNDSPEPNTFSWEATTTPQVVGTINGTKYRPTACLVINISKFEGGWENTQIKALTDILYGTNATAGQSATIPRLPSIADVIAILVPTQTIPEVRMNKHGLQLTAGDTATLALDILDPSTATPTWTSGTAATATVEAAADGKSATVTAVDAGSSIITVSITEDGVTYNDTCTVVVTAAS